MCKAAIFPIAVSLLVLWLAPASAACPGSPISNGTTADATQVMNWFNCKAPLDSPIFSGSVGIGTGSPAANLEVYQAANVELRLTAVENVNDRNAKLSLRGSGNGGALSGGAIIDFTDSDVTPGTPGALTFRKGGSTYVTVLSGGNVGIGTTSPGQPLSVVGMIRQTGCTTAGTLAVNGSGDIICSSDARLKNVLGAYKGGLDAVSHITPVLFTYKPTAKNLKETFVHAGFLAQNVRSAIPQASALQRDGFYSLETTAIVAASVNAIKELKTQLAAKGAQIAQLQSRMDRQAAQYAQLLSRLDRLERQGNLKTAAR